MSLAHQSNVEWACAADEAKNRVEPRYNDPWYNNTLRNNDTPQHPATNATVPCYNDTAAYH